MGFCLFYKKRKKIVRKFFYDFFGGIIFIYLLYSDLLERFSGISTSVIIPKNLYSDEKFIYFSFFMLIYGCMHRRS